MYAVIISTNFGPETSVYVYESKDKAMKFLKADAYNYLSERILILNEPGIECFDKEDYPDINKCAIEDEYAYILFENGDRINWEIHAALKRR